MRPATNGQVHLALWAGVAFLAGAGAAHAQDSTLTPEYDRGRNISVTERPHPEYDPKGVPFGAFRLNPAILLEGEYTDNVFASDQNKQSDVLARITPSLGITSGWARNSLSANAQISRTEHATHSSENSTDYTLTGNGLYNIGSAGSLTASLRQARITELRTASSTAADAATPTHYNQSEADLAANYTFNHLKLRGAFDYLRSNYDNATAFGGGIIDNDLLDNTLYTISGRADLALTPDTALFLAVAHNSLNYRLRPPQATIDNNSRGYEALTGVNLDLTALIRGEIGIGYQTQTYARGGSSSGLAAQTLIQYFPTQLTTITLVASQHFAASSVIGATGEVASSVSLRADHELLRNLLLNVSVQGARYDFRNIDRLDNGLTFGAGATYLLNRLVGVSVSYSHASLQSSGAQRGLAYDINDVYLSLNLRI